MREAVRGFAGSHEGRLLAVVVALGAFLSIATPSFATLQNVVDLLTSNAFAGMLAAGLLVVLVSGGIDISFTATASVAQYAAMTVANQHAAVGWLGVTAIAGAIGIVLGLLNAMLIGTLRLSSIIVTIATLNLFFGLLMFATHGDEIFALPDWFVNGASWVVYTDAQQTTYAINLQMLGLVAAFALTAVLLGRTNLGRQAYAYGSNPDAAQRVGIPVFRLNCLVYGYMGLIAGLASLVQAQNAQSVSPKLAGRARAGRAGRGGAGRRQPERRQRHRAGHHPGRGVAGVPAERAAAAGRSIVLVAGFYRRGDLGRGRGAGGGASAAQRCHPPGDGVSRAATAPPMRAAPRLGAVTLRLGGLLAALLLVFGLLLGERLFNATAIRSMAFQLPELGILSLAMMIPLLSGGLDLAIIATANLSALAMAYVFTHAPAGLSGTAALGWDGVALASGVVVALAVGLLNGLVVAYLGVSPILATLGSMTLVKGIAIGLTHGNVISGFPPGIVFLGNGTVLGVPAPLLVFAVVALPVAIMLGRSPLGTVIAMCGSNELAVRFSGIDTRRVLLRVYLLSALLSAVAGLVMMARFNSANAAYGESYLLITILAAVLGGIDPAGGFGKVSGLVLSLVALQLISTAANLLGVSEFLTLALWGAILLAAAGIGRLRLRLRPLPIRPG